MQCALSVCTSLEERSFNFWQGTLLNNSFLLLQKKKINFLCFSKFYLTVFFFSFLHLFLLIKQIHQAICLPLAKRVLKSSTIPQHLLHYSFVISFDSFISPQLVCSTFYTELSTKGTIIMKLITAFIESLSYARYNLHTLGHPVFTIIL